jgi:signal transduction histidine kinase
MIIDLRLEVDREHEEIEHLLARDRVKTDRVSAASQELRSQLTSICGYIELLGHPSDAAPSTRQQSMLDNVEGKINGILTTIESLSMLERA